MPLSSESINKASSSTARRVKMNQAAFLWGRAQPFDPGAVERLIAPKTAPDSQQAPVAVSRRKSFTLASSSYTGYRNAAYAERYRALVERVSSGGSAKGEGFNGLAEAGHATRSSSWLTRRVRVARAVYADRIRGAVSRRSFEGD
jgi:hypothetical protein